MPYIGAPPAQVSIRAPSGEDATSANDFDFIQSTFQSARPRVRTRRSFLSQANRVMVSIRAPSGEDATFLLPQHRFPCMFQSARPRVRTRHQADSKRGQ